MLDRKRFMVGKYEIIARRARLHADRVGLPVPRKSAAGAGRRRIPYNVRNYPRTQPDRI